MSTRSRAVALGILLIAVFLAGALWQRNQWPPYRQLWSLKERITGPAPAAQPEPAGMADFTELGVPVEELIDIRSAEDARQTRSALRRFIWGADSLPGLTPAAIERGVADPRWDDVRGLSRIDRLLVRMDFGLESRVDHLLPTDPNGALVVFHQGHRGDVAASAEEVEALLEAGYAVAALSMPLQGPNNQPAVTLPGLGNVRLRSHRHLAFLEPEAGHPVRYLLEPVIAVLNQLAPEYGAAPSMVGISGGGWTTTLVAALDPRVGTSVPVADSNPFYLRFERHWGDWEETIPELYRVANYLELHVLGAFGAGRRQLQILNRYDPCCHEGEGAETYADAVRERVEALGAGEWRLFVDETHREHAISAAALDSILNVLAR